MNGKIPDPNPGETREEYIARVGPNSHTSHVNGCACYLCWKTKRARHAQKAVALAIVAMLLATISLSHILWRPTVPVAPPQEGAAAELRACEVEAGLLRREAEQAERQLVELCKRGVIAACPRWEEDVP